MTNAGLMEALFTLVPGHWYAAEIISDFFGRQLRSYSPIRIGAVTPAGTGDGRFELDFYHANYPEGVRGKHYSLQTIERGERFILARSTTHLPVRILLIYEISWDWLREHFRVERAGDSNDIERWLTSHS